MENDYAILGSPFRQCHVPKHNLPRLFGSGDTPREEPHIKHFDVLLVMNLEMMAQTIGKKPVEFGLKQKCFRYKQR